MSAHQCSLVVGCMCTLFLHCVLSIWYIVISVPEIFQQIKKF